MVKLPSIRVLGPGPVRYAADAARAAVAHLRARNSLSSAELASVIAEHFGIEPADVSIDHSTRQGDLVTPGLIAHMRVQDRDVEIELYVTIPLGRA